MRILLIAAVMVLGGSSFAGAETFICKQPDGSETMTNAPTGGICKPYISGGTMNEVPDRERQPQGTMKPAEKPLEGGALNEATRLAECRQAGSKRSDVARPTLDDLKADIYFLKGCMGPLAERNRFIACFEQTVNMIDQDGSRDGTLRAEQFFKQCRR